MTGLAAGAIEAQSSTSPGLGWRVASSYSMCGPRSGSTGVLWELGSQPLPILNSRVEPSYLCFKKLSASVP